MEYKIGFTRKYYTLWSFETTYDYNASNVLVKHDRYTYIKNISFDKEKAISKYPEATVDESLNGRRGSFVKSTYIAEKDKFQFGKYKGMKFSECHDYEYMAWFYKQCSTEDQKLYLTSILCSNGYKLYGDELVSPEKLEEIHKEELKTANTEKLLEKKVPFMVTFSSSLSDYGEYLVDDLNILLSFKEYKVMTYQGFYYGLPKDEKGTSKRIKNKQVLIESYDFIKDEYNRFNVSVNKWRFA